MKGGRGPRVRRAQPESSFPKGRWRRSLPGSPPAPRPRLPAVSGGRSGPAHAAEAAGPDRPLRRCSGPVTPGASVASASSEGERPLPGLSPDEAGDPSGPRALSFPDAGTPRLRVRAAATSVCVLVRVYLRGASGRTRFGLHFAPHRPRAEFLRYPGSGGLRGATRPAPKHPLGSWSALPPRRSFRAAADARALPTRVCVGGLRRPTGSVGARGCGRGGCRARGRARWRRLPPRRTPRAADDLAPLLRSAGVHRESELRRGQEWVSSAPYPSPVSITATPKPRGENSLNKSPVARQRPLPDKSPGLGSNPRAALRAPPAWDPRGAT